ncbi:hypothetical protein FDECE_13422 [Fusarium decemcellulare]|nr:hypothetical protein FDECE_13422 [Fusarium decemcellulare]
MFSYPISKELGGELDLHQVLEQTKFQRWAPSLMTTSDHGVVFPYTIPSLSRVEPASQQDGALDPVCRTQNNTHGLSMPEARADYLTFRDQDTMAFHVVVGAGAGYAGWVGVWMTKC